MGDNQVDNAMANARLLAYAREALAADRFPNDTVTFRRFECPACKGRALRLVIEHHTGSKRRNFRGIIDATCDQCGETFRVYSFTGEHRSPMRRDSPECTCGHAAFYVAESERIERDEGIPGFVDEGVVVGMCAACGRLRRLVETD
jgi:hypothetical protein